MSIALITGASSGLGEEFARQLDKEGCNELWLVARRQDLLEKLALELNTPCKIIVCDLLSSNEIDEKIGTLLKQEKPFIKYTINNAGFGKIGNFADLNHSDMVDMVDLNCRAVVQIAHMVIPFMEEGGTLIHTSSMASFTPLGGFSVYSATKAFVTSFSIAIQAELKERNIHSMALCPGPVKTGFSKVAHVGSTHVDVVKSKATAEPVVAKALVDAKRRASKSIYSLPFLVGHLFSKILPSYWVAKISHNHIMSRPKI